MTPAGVDGPSSPPQALSSNAALSNAIKFFIVVSSEADLTLFKGGRPSVAGLLNTGEVRTRAPLLSSVHAPLGRRQVAGKSPNPIECLARVRLAIGVLMRLTISPHYTSAAFSLARFRCMPRDVDEVAGTLPTSRQAL
jgi:hypothetical protein